MSESEEYIIYFEPSTYSTFSLDNIKDKQRLEDVFIKDHLIGYDGIIPDKGGTVFGAIWKVNAEEFGDVLKKINQQFRGPSTGEEFPEHLMLCSSWGSFDVEVETPKGKKQKAIALYFSREG